MKHSDIRWILAGCLLALPVAGHAKWFTFGHGDPVVGEAEVNKMIDTPPEGTPAVVKYGEAQKTLMRGDKARDQGDVAAALANYRAAVEAYMRFSQEHPDWQPDVVRFRVAYCNNQIDALMERVAEPVAQAGSTATNVTTFAPGMDTAEIRGVMASARRLLGEGQVSGARELLLVAMKKAPDHTGLRLLLGVAQCRSGRFSDAAYLLTQLTQDDPDNARALAALGGAYFGMGYNDRAQEAIEKALTLDPALAAAWYNRAHLVLLANPDAVAEARGFYLKSVEAGGERDPEFERQLGM